jgi:THO complex subunit 3
MHPLTPSTASYYFTTLKPRTYHDPPTRNAHPLLTIRDLSWSPPGNRIACAQSDKLLRVWNPDKPEIRMSTELKGHTLPATAVVWNPTHSDLLVSCSPDHTVRSWDYRSKTALASINTGGENVALAYHPGGNMLAVAARDEKVHFIDIRTNTVAATHKLPSPVFSLSFSHAGDTLLLSTATGLVLLYDFPSLNPRHSVEAHASAAMCLELDPRGAHLAVGGSDAVVGIWDTEEWVCLRTLRMMDAPVKRVTFSYDGQYICTATDEPSHDIEIVSFCCGLSRKCGEMLTLQLDTRRYRRPRLYRAYEPPGYKR